MKNTDISRNHSKVEETCWNKQQKMNLKGAEKALIKEKKKKETQKS